ncbi:MAG: S46 family peptidase [Ignavibacteriales bacterium]|nr:S46 family peptidase [Ignavibacteriales bacterium]
MNFYSFKKINLILVLLVFTQLNFAQSDEITAPSDIFDTGKMWTFDYPPTQYLSDTYNFIPTEDWFDDVRLSALRIPGCTASFVSEDGLIMTNNHCSTWHRDAVQKEGENLEETGFYAESIDDERVVPNMYAEQLAYIVDVTDQINEAIDAVKTDDDKVDAKNTKSKELVEFYNNETGLKCQFVSLFNGGKYSIYGYKRYDDVRLVFLPEQAIASFGGDYDNFTYPRYDLDCAFFRVYDDAGKPVTSNNFFKFSENGVQKDDVIFSVGNPGSTNRLNTVSQLEYNRDISYRNRAFLLDQYYMLLDDLKTEYPDRANDFEKIRTRIGNGQKVFHYTELGLLDPYLIARKRDFENKIRAEVDADPELRDKYSNLWDSVRDLREELKPIDSKLAVYKPSRFFGSVYFSIAKDIIDHANQMKTSFGKDDPNSKKLNIDSLVNEIYPAEIDSVLEEAKLQVQLDYIRINLGNEDNLVKKLLGDLSGREAAEEVLAKSFLVNRQKVKQLLQKSPDEILNSDDPFIYFVSNTMNEIDALSKRSNEIKNTEDVLINMYGKVLFEIYGTEIPPDANFTLRLSDGVLESFDYNGTVAIEKTTFYGMYDRYYGSDQTYPWNLPERWQVPPAEFDLSTAYNFISTNDIVGGNSGSAVINKDAEVVGLAFDGNVHSIVGNFIYLPEDNRMVSVASQAIMESLDKVYKAERIVEELKTGKMIK